MKLDRRTGFLLAAAVVAGLALSGAFAFKPSKRKSSSTGGSSSSPLASFFGPSILPRGSGTVAAAFAPGSPLEHLDQQYQDAQGRKLSIVQAKKPARGVGPDGVANKTRGAGTGSGLQLDG